MLIYNYDKDTKIFINATEAFESPLDKGFFLIPSNATKKKTPNYDVNTQYCEFIEDNWVVKSIVLPPVPPEPTLDELKKQKSLEIYETGITVDTFTTSLGFTIDLSLRDYFSLLGELKTVKDIMTRKNLQNVEIIDVDFVPQKVNSNQLNTVISELEDLWYDNNVVKIGKVKDVEKAKTKDDLDKIKNKG